MTIKCFIRRLALAASVVLLGSQALAGVVITGTRVIYPASHKEVTVKLNNNGGLPALVQAWIDTGDMASSPSSSSAPFVLSPPVFRIDPSKGQSLRMMFTGSPLPQNKEAVFWLNVLEIPPAPEAASDANTLQMAFRSRIKIFFRPAGLPGDPTEAMGQIQWKLVRAAHGKHLALQAFNPSAFHVSLANVSVVANSRHIASEDGMVGPGETQTFDLKEPNAVVPAGASVEFNAINDYGALVPFEAPLLPSAFGQ
jgi:chaperone protein EcpD